MSSTHWAQDIRVYWLAFIAYWGIVLYGYDTGIAGGVVSQPFFQEHFGLQGASNKERLTDVSTNVVSVLQAGAFFGSLGSVPFSKKIGRKNTLLVFTVLFTVGAILTTIAQGSHGLAEIYAGRVIAGVGIGAITAVTPAYVSECAPKDKRGRITGLFQVMVAIGIMISYYINYGISLSKKLSSGPTVWKIPFGFQLVPAGIMFFGLLTVKESPRWLVSVGRIPEAQRNLAYYRKQPADSLEVKHELAEIEAAVFEEMEARSRVGLKQAFLGKGNWIRFVITFFLFLFQQWGGQNAVSYFAPQIFKSIGYDSVKSSLFASGVYGAIKVAATAAFIFFGVDTLGRRPSLIVSSIGMSTTFFIVGAILKTKPPVVGGGVSSASQAMAAMLYIYVCFYSIGWGPLPWVYSSEIFPTETRHYGLALASATNWLFNFNLTQVTLKMSQDLGYKLFFMFATINIGLMLPFAILIPETKGRSLEDMDVIFGSVTAEKRAADITKRERDMDSELQSSSSRGEKLESTSSVEDKV
jgi:sugar porter (SP) family MFS transporter